MGHAHFGSREDTYLSHDSASKLPLTLSARDAYIYAQKSPTLPRGMHISGGSRGGSQGAMEPPFQSRLCTDTVARLQLASSN